MEKETIKMDYDRKIPVEEQEDCEEVEQCDGICENCKKELPEGLKPQAD